MKTGYWVFYEDGWGHQKSEFFGEDKEAAEEFARMECNSRVKWTMC